MGNFSWTPIVQEINTIFVDILMILKKIITVLGEVSIFLDEMRVFGEDFPGKFGLKIWACFGFFDFGYLNWKTASI